VVKGIKMGVDRENTTKPQNFFSHSSPYPIHKKGSSAVDLKLWIF
jgi:hypothetical protein